MSKVTYLDLLNMTKGEILDEMEAYRAYRDHEFRTVCQEAGKLKEENRILGIDKEELEQEVRRLQMTPVEELLREIGYFAATCFERLKRGEGWGDVIVAECENHKQVVLIEGEDRRLIYDEDFGLLWYNSAGPEI